jgi:hypothetical protein
MTYEHLLKIDKNKQLLDCKFNNSTIPIYLIFRAHIFHDLFRNQLSLETLTNNKKPYSILNIFKYLVTSLTKNIFFAPKKEIYMFSSEVIFIKKERFYENRLFKLFNDHFSKKSQLISNSGERVYKSPKRAKVYYQNLINDISVVVGWFSKLNPKDNIAIDLFMQELRLDENVSLTEKQYEKLYVMLVKTAKRKDFFISAYDLFFKWKKPKLLILEDAHYLGENAFILYAAKKNGVVTAEFQHGYVGKSHFAYNFDESLYPILKEILPTYFFTFGAYWNKKIRTPANKIVIGNTHLTENAKQFSKIALKQEKLNLLIVSVGYHSKEILELCHTFLNGKISSIYNIILRPHPRERASFEVRYKSVLENGVILDINDDLYQTLKDVSIVVSPDFSTVLYEAMLFTKKIFLLNTNRTKLYDSNPIFMIYNDNQDLIRLIMEEQEIDIETNEIWDTESHSNFNSFLTQI